jgi:aerobic-type carbon monoxide dehydrogenase small subunit (CoxS/CutS family)
MSVCELLERGPILTTRRSATRSAAQICRCTGYQAIVDAVKLAATKVARRARRKAS